MPINEGNCGTMETVEELKNNLEFYKNELNSLVAEYQKINDELSEIKNIVRESFSSYKLQSIHENKERWLSLAEQENNLIQQSLTLGNKIAIYRSRIKELTKKLSMREISSKSNPETSLNEENMESKLKKINALNMKLQGAKNELQKIEFEINNLTSRPANPKYAQALFAKKQSLEEEIKVLTKQIEQMQTPPKGKQPGDE